MTNALKKEDDITATLHHNALNAIKNLRLQSKLCDFLPLKSWPHEQPKTVL